MTEEQMQVWISEQIQTIKTKMPETYKAIQDRDKGITQMVGGTRATLVPAYGAEVFSLVRRGLRGETNCFWAMEGGYVMGTPFTLEDSSRDTAWAMVSYGCLHVCIFRPLFMCEAAHGTN
jgi:hypothetical protein